MDDNIKKALEDLPAVEPRPEYRSRLRQKTRALYLSNTAVEKPARKHRSLPWAISAAAAILAMVFVIPHQKISAHIESEGLGSLSRNGNTWVKMADKTAINEKTNTLYIPTGSKSKIILPSLGSFTAANDCRVDIDCQSKTVRLNGGILNSKSDETITIILEEGRRIKVNGQIEINLCLPGGECVLKQGRGELINNNKRLSLATNQRISLKIKHNKTVSPTAAKMVFEKLKSGDNVKNILDLHITKTSQSNYVARLVLARRLQDKQALDQLIFSLPQLKNLDLSDQYEVMRLINSHPLQDVVNAQKKAFFGVIVKEVEPRLRKIFESHLGVKNGVIINSVVDNSPAKAAGLKRKDIILSVGDTQILNKDDLFNAITAYKPKDSVKIVFLRNGTINHSEVTLADAPDYLKAKRPDIKQLQEELSKQIAPDTAEAKNADYMKRLKVLLDKMVLKAE